MTCLKIFVSPHHLCCKNLILISFFIYTLCNCHFNKNNSRNHLCHKNLTRMLRRFSSSASYSSWAAWTRERVTESIMKMDGMIFSCFSAQMKTIFPWFHEYYGLTLCSAETSCHMYTYLPFLKFFLPLKLLTTERVFKYPPASFQRSGYTQESVVLGIPLLYPNRSEKTANLPYWLNKKCPSKVPNLL